MTTRRVTDVKRMGFRDVIVFSVRTRAATRNIEREKCNGGAEDSL
jgi:hypothetical protein